MDISVINNFKQKLVSEKWDINPDFCEKLMAGERVRCSHADGSSRAFFIKESMVCGRSSPSGDYLFRKPVKKEYITSEKWQ